ncbi:hypothetical protein [Amycolatopsis pithecellobii]|uniref:Uncharacterized protein n=1 Tax=Amycolatopsis pithecellobii TaxID=664692 RepID=A0A6N7Z153_9PSEU|nr:hypothetical protein [Amycolatopsis pithecellobii]MTD53360.1 hypothetical protein [Amycolatopsis pithecellobii]
MRFAGGLSGADGVAHQFGDDMVGWPAPVLGAALAGLQFPEDFLDLAVVGDDDGDQVGLVGGGHHGSVRSIADQIQRR